MQPGPNQGFSWVIELKMTQTAPAINVQWLLTLIEDSGEYDIIRHYQSLSTCDYIFPGGSAAFDM